tara:strand:+ start:53 stop:445 length:393 start_codon:yes stop_codon:yes gene_type:complete
MLFEDDYNRIIHERIEDVVRDNSGIFSSKERFLELFCEYHDVEVTMKTFNKWLDKCHYKVFDQVKVVRDAPINYMEGSITDAVDDFMVPADLPVMNPIPQQVNEMSPKLMQRYGIDDEDAFDNESKEDHK